MSADKSNRISDDSGVVCFNTMEDHHQAFTDSSSNSSSSAMFLTAERHQKSSDNASPSSLLQYKSVYSNSSSLHSSIITTTVPVKRREKRGNYVIGSGQVPVAGENSVHEDNAPTTNKYGVKRLSHVQQMRLRFENWCNINNEVKRCEASHCKGVKEEQFDSLPIIPFAKGSGDKRPLLVESPRVEEEEVTKVLGGRGDKHKPAVQESPPNPPQSPLVCECSDNEGGVEANGNQGEQEEEEGSFRENGKLSMFTELRESIADFKCQAILLWNATYQSVWELRLDSLITVGKAAVVDTLIVLRSNSRWNVKQQLMAFLIQLSLPSDVI